MNRWRVRGFLESLAIFQQEDESLNLQQVWALRSDPAIFEAIEARYEILRMRMSGVNPAYFNAARSLGLLFEEPFLRGGRTTNTSRHMADF